LIRALLKNGRRWRHAGCKNRAEFPNFGIDGYRLDAYDSGAGAMFIKDQAITKAQAVSTGATVAD
jgi:hypothetical protein